MRKTAVDVVKAALERVIRSFEEDVRLSEMSDAELEELARAAIEALREPSEEMVRGAYDAGWPTDYRDAYRAMIDAALTEERAGE